MFDDDIGYLLYTSTVPLQLRATHVCSDQESTLPQLHVFQGCWKIYNEQIAEFQTNPFETVRLLESLLEICIMVSFLLSNNNSGKNFFAM